MTKNLSAFFTLLLLFSTQAFPWTNGDTYSPITASKLVCTGRIGAGYFESTQKIEINSDPTEKDNNGSAKKVSSRTQSVNFPKTSFFSAKKIVVEQNFEKNTIQIGVIDPATQKGVGSEYHNVQNLYDPRQTTTPVDLRIYDENGVLITVLCNQYY